MGKIENGYYYIENDVIKKEDDYYDEIETVGYAIKTNTKKMVKDLKHYLDTNEEKGVVYIPKFIVEKWIDLLS